MTLRPARPFHPSASDLQPVTPAPPAHPILAGRPPHRTQKQNDIITQLEAQAAHEEEMLLKKRPRHQSSREEEWITRLVEKHGDDIKAMVRDKKLNPMQQTEGDIGRRLKKWKAKHEAST